MPIRAEGEFLRVAQRAVGDGGEAAQDRKRRLNLKVQACLRGEGGESGLVCGGEALDERRAILLLGL